MNTTELLDQFILESREGLELIGKRLLEVERNPGDADTAERPVPPGAHAQGQLRAVRVQGAGARGACRRRPARPGAPRRLAYSVEIADAPAGGDGLHRRAGGCDRAARRAAGGGRRARTGAGRGAAPASGQAERGRPPRRQPRRRRCAEPSTRRRRALPAWAARVPEAWLQVPGVTALRYRPEPECFFKGEDPWHLARSAPGLQHLAVSTREPWAGARGLRLLPLQPRTADRQRRAAAGTGAALPLRARATGLVERGAQPTLTGDMRARRSARCCAGACAALWDEQRSLLAVPDVADSAVAAVRMVLRNLLVCSDGCALGAWGSAAMTHDALAAAGALPRRCRRRWRPGRSSTRRKALHPAADARCHCVGQAGRARSGRQRRRRGASRRHRRGGDECQAAAGGPRQVKVAQDKIDRLMDLIGEMVVAKNALPYLAERAENALRAARAGARDQGPVRGDQPHRRGHAARHHAGAHAAGGRGVPALRPAGARHQPQAGQGRAAWSIEGEDTEADKNIIEALADPLIHILRNSLDHGIELPAVRRGRRQAGRRARCACRRARKPTA